MTLEVVADLAGLERRADAWASLWADDVAATPFQHPACQLAWARTHAPDRTFALTASDGGRTTALVAAFTWEGSALLAGTGPTDYGGGVFAPDVDAGAVLAALAEETRRRGAARLDLRQLRPGDPLLDAPAPPGWADAREADEVCPVSSLCGEDGLGAVPGRAAQRLGWTGRKAERAGGFDVEAATPATTQAHLDHLFAFHRARWNALGEPGVLDDGLMQAFLREAAPAWVRAGVARLRTLSLAGRPAATLLALHGAGACHMYLTGFDPAQAALGPGALLIAATLRGAHAEGCTEARWLRGREPYKYRWGAEDRPTWRRVLTPR